MLAVAQGLVRRPRLLMLDEPSAGLSPVLVDRVFVVVRRLRETGTAVLLVEQLIEKALALADRVYALARGSIVLEAQHRRGRPAAPAGARLFRDHQPLARAASHHASGGGRNTTSCLAESATTSGGFCSFMPWIAQNRS